MVYKAIAYHCTFNFIFGVMTTTILLPAPQLHNYNKIVFACINALMDCGCILTGHSPVMCNVNKVHLIIGQDSSSFFTYTDYVKIKIKMPKEGGNIIITINVYQAIRLLSFTHIFLMFRLKNKIKKLINDTHKLEQLYNTQKFIPNNNLKHIEA